jgi:hypothetical protein
VGQQAQRQMRLRWGLEQMHSMRWVEVLKLPQQFQFHFFPSKQQGLR